MKDGRLGFMLLGIWLIAAGAMPLMEVSFRYSGTLMEVLAIVSGILILIQSRSSGSRWW